MHIYVHTTTGSCHPPRAAFSPGMKWSCSSTFKRPMVLPTSPIFLRLFRVLLPLSVVQEANGWLFHAARAPSTAQCDAILKQHVLPTKPKVYEEMVQRPRSQWAHSGGPADTVIADQVTSNVAESTMSQVGGEVRQAAEEVHLRFLEGWDGACLRL